MIAGLSEARVAKRRDGVGLPVAALATIGEAIAADGPVGCTHEGFVLIARDLVPTDSERLADGNPALG